MKAGSIGRRAVPVRGRIAGLAIGWREVHTIGIVSNGIDVTKARKLELVQEGICREEQ